MKAPRNKTIDLSVKDGKEYLDRCLILKDAAKKDQIKDRIIRGDLFRTASLLPSGFADLVIADPPYNLDKTFSSVKFTFQNNSRCGKPKDRFFAVIMAKISVLSSIHTSL